MRIRPSILLFCAVILALIVLLLWRKHSTTFSREAAPPKPTEANTPVAVAQSRTNSALTPAPINSANPAIKSKAQQMLEGLSTLNDIPIVFYGKVLDQFNNPVANATVNFGVRVYNGRESTVKYGEMFSDANGSFTISGYKGESLGVGVKKPGYAWVGMNGSGIYSKLYPEDQRAHPDPNDPTIIKMWKLQGPQHLTSFNFNTRIPIDGTQVRFDFQSSQQVQTGGDLIIQLQSSAKPNIRQEYDWHLIFKLPNGGIVESGNPGLQNMFQAPDSGYETQLSLDFQKNSRQWTPRFDEDLYFTRQDGTACYGKLWMKIDTDLVKGDSVPLTLKGSLNPSGSHNLETISSAATQTTQ